MADSTMLCRVQLQKLLEHKYNARGSSIAEIVLQPFWRRVVEFMPLWLAPNTITILGLAVNILTSLSIICICPLAFGQDQLCLNYQLSDLLLNIPHEHSNYFSLPLLQISLAMVLALFIVVLMALRVCTKSIQVTFLSMAFKRENKAVGMRWSWFEICPSALICCCIGLFIYQTLDAIDGKQARRTGNSSPLGELFDHGCDSLSVVFVSLATACTLNLGKYPHFMFFFFFNNSIIFYLAHWQTYVTGTLIFGRIDVTEVQILGCATFTITAIYGVDLWSNEVSVFGTSLTMAQIAVLFCALNSTYYMLNSFSKILAGGVGKNKSTVSDTSVLSPAIPLGIVLACAFYVYKHSASNLFQTAPCLVDLMYGITIAKLTCKLVIATMTKHPLDMIDSCMLGPAALSFVNYFSLPVSEWHALVVILVFEILNMTIFCAKVCIEISSFLGIRVFRVKEKKEQ